MEETIIKEPIYSNIGYDDAFRTMVSKCDDILIPFVNYFFNENYNDTAVITRLQNEQLTEEKDKKPKKRITDSHFTITQSGETKKFHVECESKPYDGSLLLRLFEYDSEIAICDSEVEADTIIVRFPYTGLLMLRDSRKTPKTAKVIITTPDGEVTYRIPIMKEADFSLNEIFEKQLYLLIPFYIFNFEKDFKSINADKDKTEALGEMIKEIIVRLDDALKNSKLSANSHSVIMKVTHSVMSKLTKKHDAIQEKVGDIMGGKVLDDPEVAVYKYGLAKGISQGISQGEANATFKFVQKGKLTLEEGATELGMTVAEFEEAMTKAGFKLPETV